MSLKYKLESCMVHIRHLREKIKDSSDNPENIKTIWGVNKNVCKYYYKSVLYIK